MGRKKKINNIGANELDELNLIHNMIIHQQNEPINSNNNLLDKTEPNINLVQDTKIDGVQTANLNETVPIKKKRGRKKIINESVNKTKAETKAESKSVIKVKGRMRSMSNHSEKSIETNIKSNLTNTTNIMNTDKLSDSDENNNGVLKELLIKQLKNIPASKKLLFGDIKRISKFLTESIFDENKCSLWHGYITNEKNQSKGTYINFYFNKKKIALHRLIYINFVGEISNDEYIKFSCDNKGKCCCIYHMKKYSYNSKLLENQNVIQEGNKPLEKTTIGSVKASNSNESNNVHINRNKDKLSVEF